MFYKHPNKLRGIGKIQYPARIIGIGLAALVYWGNQIQSGELQLTDYIMLSSAIVYPHVALLIYWKSNSNRVVETNMLLVDAIFSGIAIPLMAFNPLPSICMISFSAAGTMVAKGYKHYLKGLGAIVIGGVIGLFLNGFSTEVIFHNETTVVVTTLIFIVIYSGMFAFASNQFVVQIIKNKRLISEQQTLIEEQHSDIMDSINYAKRIQTAILPSNERWYSSLQNSFVLYLPKDVVAGDFYWLNRKNETLLFAAADCTGHGVPGAMVSVVCNNALNRAVKEFNLSKPGEILDKTRELVVEEFSLSEGDVKDGMDIALCSLHGNILHFSGANNPLWIVRKDLAEIEEIKGTKQPVGLFEGAVQFETHKIELFPGDRFYLFSDGFADQFGGEQGKKYKSRRMKNLLLEIQNKSMQEQKNHLQEEFETWRGDLEQLDDICIIGVDFS